MLNRKIPSFSKILLAVSLIANVCLAAYAYVHYVVQVDNIFTIGAEYRCKVSVSEWNTEDKLREFGVQKGQVLGRGLGANLYWGEMVGQVKSSPVINITNTSPDKAENITWVAINLPNIGLDGYYVIDEAGNVGDRWVQGAPKRLAIGESFQCVFYLLYAGGIADGTYSFDIDIRCED